MADKKFTQLPVAGVFTASDLLPIAQSPFGAGSSKSVTGADLAVFINATVSTSSLYLLKAGDTMTGDILFSLDNTKDIGATGATRPRTLFVGTSVDSPAYHFGGTTSSFPALTRSTTFLDAVLADASGPCQISCGKNALGVTPTDALIIKNTTPAALGAQQLSPALHLKGAAWGTTASTSQSVDWRIYINATQSTTGRGQLFFDSSLNGAAFSTKVSISDAGSLTATSLSSTGTLSVTGAVTLRYLAIVGATVLDTTHYCVNATSGTFDVTLPTAVSVAGRTYVIKNSGTGVVTLKANGAEVIDAVASWIINQYTSLTVMSDGAGWILI